MRRFLYIVLFVISIGLQAQQYSLPSQFDRNMLYLNPSYAGSHEATVASVMHRMQWVNMPGALTFQNFEFHTPLKKESMALGIQARNESIGLKNNTEAFFIYSYRIRLDESTIALALKGGGQNITFSDADLTNVNDPSFNSTSAFVPNVGFGMSYYSSKYFVGLSVPYFFGTVSNADGTQQIDFGMDRLAFSLSGGGTISLSDNIDFKPSGAVVYYMSLATQFAAVANFYWNDLLLVGVGYRHKEGILVNAGYFVNQQLSVAYTYDYNIGEVGAYSNGSHEIGLLYYFGYKVNTINPRDF